MWFARCLEINETPTLSVCHGFGHLTTASSDHGILMNAYFNQRTPCAAERYNSARWWSFLRLLGDI